MENTLASFVNDLDELRKFFAEHNFDRIDLEHIKRPGYNGVIDSFKNENQRMEISVAVNYKDDTPMYECYYQPNPLDNLNIEYQVFYSVDDVIKWANSKF